ncbi:MAG: hypothetical protein AAF772_14235 [Acidobacteriota bacterium]
MRRDRSLSHADPTTAPDVDDVRLAFVQLWGTLGPRWGIPPAVAQVYSWLLSRADPADTDTLMDGLNMSRGAVSMACRELRDWGLISAVRAPGSRRVAFQPATDFEKVVRNIVRTRKRREWDPVVESLREWIPQLDRIESDEAAVFRERLESLEALVGRIDRLIEILLGGGLIARLGLKMLIQSDGDPARDVDPLTSDLSAMHSEQHNDPGGASTPPSSSEAPR